MKTLYDLLGVRPKADDATIRAAFRKAVKAYHPDANAGDRTAEQRFMEITAAHAILRDPDRRAHYDRALDRRRQKLLREWKITLVGWGLSAVLSAGVVSAAVLVVPKWLGKSNLPATAFATQFPAPNGKGDASAATPVATTVVAEGTAKPKEEVNPTPLTSGQTAQQSKHKQRDPAPEQTASTGDQQTTRQPALADAGPPAAPATLDGRAPGREPNPPRTKDEPAAAKGNDRHRETRIEAFMFGDDRLADGLLRTHIFDRDEVEQILGFAEAGPDQSADEDLPEKLRHSAKHHHHREHRAAFRRGRVPRG
jgi:curved DNA-binding protein CbpA